MRVCVCVCVRVRVRVRVCMCVCVSATLADTVAVRPWFAEERPPSVTDSDVEDVDSSLALSRRASGRYGSAFQVSGHTTHPFLPSARGLRWGLSVIPVHTERKRLPLCSVQV